MKEYLDLLKRVLIKGDPQYNNRTGQLMLVSAGDQSIFDLREGFPRCTTRSSVNLRWVGEELFWMLRGERNAKTLYDKGVDIWNRNAFQHYLKRNGLDSRIKKNTLEWETEYITYQEKMKSDSEWKMEDSDLGPVYGWQWRHWPKREGGEIDQIQNVIEGIKKDKGSRYHIFTAWNPADVPSMALGPCHVMAHLTITRDKDLDLHMFQRSCDIYLGVPFNIAQYSLLNHLIAMETNLTPRKFIHTYSNVHIYCGVPPRSDFLKNENNLIELQDRARNTSKPEDFINVKQWYLENAPPESQGNEKKDHVPFVLEQLSKTPLEKPKIKITKMPFFSLIQQPFKDVASLEGPSPQKWDSKATMAA